MSLRLSRRVHDVLYCLQDLGIESIPLALSMPFFHPLSLMNQNRAVFGVNLGHLWHEVDKLRLWMQRLLQGVAEGWVRPHVDKTFPLAQAGEAQAYIEARRNVGKVVLTPEPSGQSG